MNTLTVASPVATKQTFAENFKAIMRHLDINVKIVADELEIDEMRVRRWQDGVCYPQLSVLARLCFWVGYYDILVLITRNLTPEEIAVIPKK